MSCVQATNDDSILSKSSMIKANYAHDPYIDYFAHEANEGRRANMSPSGSDGDQQRRRAPLIHRGYYLRHMAIEKIVLTFIKTCMMQENSKQSPSLLPLQIVSLGAGFDTLFFRLSDALSALQFHQDQMKSDEFLIYFVEIDYEGVMERKKKIIENYPLLHQHMPSSSRQSSGRRLIHYSTRGCDLSDLSGLERVLFSQEDSIDHETRLNRERLTFVFAECSLTYMSSDSCDRLIEWFGENFERLYFLTYEQVGDVTSEFFTKKMVDHFEMKKQSPLRNIKKYPTVASQKDRYQRLMKRKSRRNSMPAMVEAITLFDYYHGNMIGKQEKIRIQKLEPFDEWEAWHMTCLHYMILLARNFSLEEDYANDSEAILFSVMKSLLAIPKRLQQHIYLSPILESSQNLKIVDEQDPQSISLGSPSLSCPRWGQGMCLLDDRFLVFCGGWGESNEKESGNQRRQADLVLMTRQGELLKRIDISSLACFNWLPRMYPTVVALDKSRVLIFGGRASPLRAFSDAIIVDTETWTITSVNVPESIEGRYRSCAVLLGNRWVLIMGGLNSLGHCVDDTLCYDIELSVWKRLFYRDENEKNIFGFHSCEAILTNRSRLWLFGGLDEDEHMMPIRFLELNFDESQASWAPVLLDSLPVYGYSMSAYHDEENCRLLVSPGVCSNQQFRDHMLILSTRFTPEISTDDSPKLSNADSLKLCLKACLKLPDSISSRFLPASHKLVVGNDPKEDEEHQIYCMLGGGMNCFSFGSHMNRFIPQFRVIYTQIPVYDGTEGKQGNFLWSSSSLKNREFVEQILKRRTPCIFRNLPFMSASCWTWNHLKNIFSELQVSLHVSESQKLQFTPRNYTFQVMEFLKFIEILESQEDKMKTGEKNMSDDLLSEFRSEMMDTTTDEIMPNRLHYYLRSIGSNPRKEVADVWQAFPELFSGSSPAFFLPDFLKDLLGSSYYSSVLRMGSPRTHLWTHYDVMDNLLFQIYGRKRVVFFPPTDVSCLYVEGSSSKVIDIDSPNLSEFPLFRDSHPIQCILNPGDILYIPALWFHNVASLRTPSIAINYFWKHLDDNTLYEKKDLYGNKDYVPATKALSLTTSLASCLAQIPCKDARMFYTKRICHILDQINEGIPETSDSIINE